MVATMSTFIHPTNSLGHNINREVLKRSKPLLLLAKLLFVLGVFYGNTAFAQLEGTKAFSPISIAPSQPATMTIQLINSGPNPAINTTFVDTFPTGMTAIGTAYTSSCDDPGGAPGVVTVASGSVTLTGGYVPAATGSGPGRCEIEVTVTNDSTGSYVNTIPSGGVTSSLGANNDPIQATLVSLITDITIGGARSGNRGWGGATDTWAEFTFYNGNPIDLTGGAFSAPFHAAVIAATSIPPTTTCVGATASTTATSFDLSGMTIPANGSCKLRVYVEPAVGVNVVSATNITVQILAGTVSFDQADVTNVNAGGAGISIATGLRSKKVFSPNVMGLGQTATLTLTLQNANFSDLTDVTFVDSLPAGMTFVPGSISTTCGNGVEDAGDLTQFKVTGADLGGGKSIDSFVMPECTITGSVVTSGLGLFENTFGGSGTTVVNDAGVNVTLHASEADLLVINNGGVGINKYATVYGTRYSSSDRQGLGISAGSDWVYEIVFGNSNSTDVNNVSLTDDIGTLLPSFMHLYNADASFTGDTGCTGTLVADEATDVVSLSNATIPANGSCTLSFKVFHGLEANGSRTFIDNTIPGSAISIDGLNYPIDVKGPTFRSNSPFDPRKFFTPTTVGPGGVSRLRVLIVMYDTGYWSDSSFGFVDTLPSPLVVADDPDPSFNCGGTITAVPGSNTISFTGDSTTNVPGFCDIYVNVKADVLATDPPGICC